MLIIKVVGVACQVFRFFVWRRKLYPKREGDYSKICGVPTSPATQLHIGIAQANFLESHLTHETKLFLDSLSDVIPFIPKLVVNCN